MDSPELQEATPNQQIAAAREKVTMSTLNEPRAKSAYYDPASDRIVVQLQFGATFSFPAKLGQGLAAASPEDLAEVEVTPSGIGLHWEKLDADLSVPALLQGIYGNPAWMAQIAAMAA